MKERIQKVLANAGVASRRNIEEMVLQGRVTVNGKVLTHLPLLIDAERDKVSVDGETVKLRSARAGPPGKGGRRGPRDPEDAAQRRYYLLLHKPKGVYTTNVAQGEQVRAIDLLPPDFPARVYPVGRLDAESTGLLLLTNDGELTNQLTHPRYGIPKTYRAMVDGDVTAAEIIALEKGVYLADKEGGGGFKARAAHIKLARRFRDRTLLEITLREGKNRQIRRMLAKVGHKVRELSRIKMGSLTLEGVAPGKFRPLSPKEVRQLRELAAHNGPPRERTVAHSDDRPRATAARAGKRPLVP